MVIEVKLLVQSQANDWLIVLYIVLTGTYVRKFRFALYQFTKFALKCYIRDMIMCFMVCLYLSNLY